MATRKITTEPAVRVTYTSPCGRARVERHGPRDYLVLIDDQPAGFYEYSFQAEHAAGVALCERLTQEQSEALDAEIEAAALSQSGDGDGEDGDPVIGIVGGAPVYGYINHDGVTGEDLRFGAYVTLNGMHIAAYPQTEPEGEPEHINVNKGRDVNFCGEITYAEFVTLRAMGAEVDALMEMARRWCAEVA